MKKYMLRKCGRNGNSSNGFKYPMTVGAKVVAPDWDPDPVCGGGLHGLEEANGNWYLLEGEKWQVISYQVKDRVIIDHNKVKIRKGIIEYVGGKSGLIEFVKNKKLNPVNQSVVEWAKIIGDKDIMRDRVTSSFGAFFWAIEIGDRDVMINKITRSNEAVDWARHIGNEDIMVKRVRSLYQAQMWLYFDLPFQKQLLKKFPKLK